MRRFSFLVVTAFLILAAKAPQWLSESLQQPEPFVEKLVEAINSKSLEARKALAHPKSLECASSEADSFYHWMANRQTKNTIPVQYKWKMKSIAPGQPLLFADRFDYPVHPTHLLQLDFETGPSRSMTMLFQLARDAGRWHEVIPCPKPATMVSARAARQDEAQRLVRTQELVAKMTPQLKQQVMEFLKLGRRIDAIKHYQSVSGEDLTTSVEVVNLLTSQPADP